MPIKRLTELCHRHDVIVLVDGAQAPGQLPLDLQDYDADFYTGIHTLNLRELNEKQIYQGGWQSTQ